MGYKGRPDISSEEIGIRTFQLRKEKAEERAIEKIRQGLGDDWSKLSKDQLEKLTWALGEVWAHIARRQWDHIPFSSLTIFRVEEIVKVAQQVLDHTKVGSEGLEEIQRLLEQG